MNSIFRKFRRKPLRTFLTVLQILLGSLAMTLALSTYLDALQRQTASKPDQFELIAGTKDAKGNVETTYSMLDQAGVDKLLEQTPALEKAALLGDIYASMTAEKEGKLYQFQSAAFVNAAYFEINKVDLTSGSFFTSQDAESSEALMLISDAVANVLFGETPALGQTLSIIPDESMGGSSPEAYKIIGTYRERETVRPYDLQYGAFLPIWKIPYDGGAGTMTLLAKSGQGEEAREQILNSARQVFSTQISEWGIDKDNMFFINELGQDMWNQSTNNLLDPTVVMFGLFGIVALIVGSIGIFSIMLVDALERERDTGIKRALGATKARITKEMTLEATLIAGLGGLLGVLLAALVIPWLASQVGDTLFWNVSLQWQPFAALIVFVLTLLLGMVLGFFPALRAASVKPVEALKGV
jgi:putative ABC transport system permease protein